MLKWASKVVMKSNRNDIFVVDFYTRKPINGVSDWQVQKYRATPHVWFNHPGEVVRGYALHKDGTIGPWRGLW